MPVPSTADADLGETGRVAPGMRFPPETVAALSAHPRFPEAARRVAQCLLSLYRGNRLLNQLVNDRGRFLLAFLLLHFHYSRRPDDPQSGLTAGRVVETCVTHGICSRGRAKALLMLMRVAGYIAPAPDAADRRYRVLVPTERLIALHHDRWRCQFEAMALVLPEAATALTLLERPAFAPAFLRPLVAHFMAGNRVIDYSPELSGFIDRNAGFLILMSLLLAGDPEQPERPAAISISGLARRFGVSRAHVLKFLRDAAEEGLIAREGHGAEQIRLLPRFLAAMHSFIASAFLFNALAAREAIDATAGAA
ncbi:MAG: hypothetical protein C3F17_03410 [Bradyrhizobiaceae bacterium]|nr:MAG: hypothetical protein C3F17_03410 [Bradyrhizobiaceae bacterium]